MTTTNDQPDRHLNESLSALMDNEANEVEMHRVLDRLKDDEALRKTAFSYQLIGETIRNESSAFANVDLSSSISQAIDQERPVNTGEHSVARWQSVGRFAVAVSVALAVVVGVQLWNGQQKVQPDVASVREPDRPLVTDNGTMVADYGAVGVLAGYGAEQKGLSPTQLNRARVFADNVARERFNTYMLQHAEQQSSYTVQGMLPFVRAASFERP